MNRLLPNAQPGGAAACLSTIPTVPAPEKSAKPAPKQVLSRFDRLITRWYGHVAIMSLYK